MDKIFVVNQPTYLRAKRRPWVLLVFIIFRILYIYSKSIGYPGYGISQSIPEPAGHLHRLPRRSAPALPSFPSRFSSTGATRLRPPKRFFFSPPPSLIGFLTTLHRSSRRPKIAIHPPFLPSPIWGTGAAGGQLLARPCVSPDVVPFPTPLTPPVAVPRDRSGARRRRSSSSLPSNQVIPPPAHWFPLLLLFLQLIVSSSWKLDVFSFGHQIRLALFAGMKFVARSVLICTGVTNLLMLGTMGIFWCADFIWIWFGSEQKAKDVLLYHYKHAAKRFSAKLTPSRSTSSRVSPPPLLHCPITVLGKNFREHYFGRTKFSGCPWWLQILAQYAICSVRSPSCRLLDACTKRATL